METTETVFIGLGSNLGDSVILLQEGWKSIGSHQGVTLDTISLPYLSSPVGMASHFWFTNAVGMLTTSLTAGEILELLLDTEKRLGRARDESRRGYQDREIDLDLLYFGAQIMDSPRLTVPHPHRNDRLFVLEPMAAIAPDFIDPETRYPIAEMHRRLKQRIASGKIEGQEITAGAWPD
ncbi:MAG: 2-amino-4-hydroxy-6-hydroxymethyldihydropteridine diphosphokinase [Desulfofustis sp.]|nr:2-amino-4-hydroxy-6-hydroxymethyldihydropteridine diphosphokinase [Desulfofustis sp.]MBT8355126.1 2-amino-4-hydroxy-6-hydroxymethyldihydropteridine diphosphokinase [Desulfofustis sp.]